MSPWASYVTFLGFIFFIPKQRQIMPALESIFEDQREFINHLTEFSLQ